MRLRTSSLWTFNGLACLLYSLPTADDAMFISGWLCFLISAVHRLREDRP